MRIHVALLLLVLPLGAIAQVNKSNLVGVVRDSSGAAAPGVTIKITSADTGAIRQEVSDDSGLYHASLLDVGTYNLEAEKSGFKKVVKQGIRLAVGETITVDLALEVGALAETVTVSAAGEQLRTETGSLGSTLESQSIAQLPTIGRNPYVFVALTAGIQYTGDPTYVNPWDASGPSAFTANGFGSGTSQFLLDGVPNMRMDVVSFSPSPDAVEEMRAQTNAFDAEYGHSAAAFINVTTRGGTNSPHGGVYDYLRNEALNANDFFSNRSGLKKSKFHQDTYGGSLGGPVTLPKVYRGHDRTFFFVDYEGTQLRQGGNTASIVPTVLQRSGDFSQTFNTKAQLITVYDPTTTVLGSNGKYTRAPFPQNIIPKSLLDPVAQNLLKFYALPNLTPAPGTLQNFVGDGVPSGVSTRSWNSVVTRIDHRINSAQSLFFRFGWNHRTDTTKPYYGIPGADSVLGDADGFFRSNFAGAVGYTWALKANMVLDVRAGITRYGEGNIEDTLGMDMTSLGFPASFAKSTPYPLFPTITMSTGDAQSLGGGNTPSRRYINQLNPEVNVHSIYGRHAVKYGMNLIGVQDNNFSSARSGGSFSFNRSFTQGPDPTVSNSLAGYDVASFVLGTPGSGFVDFNAVPATTVKYFGLYAQDDWKVSDRLTLNFGVRVEHEGPITERFNRGNSGFDPNAASPLAAKAAANFAANTLPQLKQLNVSQLTQFNVMGGLGFLGVGGAPSGYLAVPALYYEPRFGFAYRISNRIVWRGGYGLFIAPNNNSNFQTNGFSLQTQMVTSLDNNLTPFHTLSNPFPSGVAVPPGASGGLLTAVGKSLNSGVAAIGSVPDFKDGMNQQFSTGFQFLLPGQVSLETSYVGNNVQHLAISRNLDQYPVADLALGNLLNSKVANPFFGVITDTTSSLSQSTVALSQLLLPFPQYTGVTQSSLPLGRSHYNAFQAMVNKRTSKGLTLTGAFTFSKYMTKTSYHNMDDASLESVIDSADRPKNFVVSGLYELPFGPAKSFCRTNSPVIKRLVGGWELGWTGTYTSGAALSFSGAERVSTSKNNPQTVLQWFDTTQFVSQAPFTLQRTSSRIADIRGPGLGMWNVTLVKNTAITERVKFRLEAQAFNFLNTPFFGNPNTSVTSTSFGQITGLYSGSASRNVQVAGRISF
ncbi:MAG TPA: TonB-dependent receptor [Bryobacteraceae bacterium]|nr:TonB-dependent receptor [Bryobacteraceae bacterium]